MLKKSIAVVFAIALAMTATVASAQCNIAAYADPGGTQSTFNPTEGETFSIFVVLFVEDTAGAAAYSMTYPQGSSGMFLTGRFTGPSGDGLVIGDPAAGQPTIAALGECVIGFDGFPVLIDEYQFVVLPGFLGGPVVLGPNPVEDPDFPVYVTCTDIKKPCDVGADFQVGPVIPTEASSFGSIKSLYN